MKIPIYQVDAFTSQTFSGNPAAVCLLKAWLPDQQLQSIAAENNLSETAFLVKNDDGYDLRWFTPTTEVALCGHATLASAHVLFACRQWPQKDIRFRTRKSGPLVVTKRGDLLEMDLPSKPAHPRTPPSGLQTALRADPPKTLGAGDDILLVLESEKAVQEMRPDFSALERVDCRDVIITARGERSDFVSRCFALRDGIPEDPVTGSAHCILIPYWAGVLGKNDLHAFQVSKRGGELFCAYGGKRVKISGRAALYLEGTITIPDA
jgi:PhzF family phenazine biosynthesis protein